MKRLLRHVVTINLWQTALFLLFGLILSSCHRATPTAIATVNSNLPNRVNNSSDKTVIAMMKSLNSKHQARVVSIGQNYLISIPAASIFNDQSPHIKWESFALLNQIVKFMKNFHKIGVTVTCYSSKYHSEKRQHALTLERARIVADYLWYQGIDSRFIFTEGAGSSKPIASYAPADDRATNSRIEITFRDEIV